MDRYYSGIDIYLGLYEKGIKATGTIMTNKVNLPKENIAEIKLNTHELKAFNHDNKLSFLVWQDKKPIYILSNIYYGYIITKTKIDHSKKQINLGRESENDSSSPDVRTLPQQNNFFFYFIYFLIIFFNFFL